jgi:hypothetical protein
MADAVDGAGVKQVDLTNWYIGRAVQVHPIKPALTAPGTKLLRLEFDGLLSTFAFKFSLRRYTSARWRPRRASPTPRQGGAG